MLLTRAVALGSHGAPRSMPLGQKLPIAKDTSAAKRKIVVFTRMESERANARMAARDHAELGDHGDYRAEEAKEVAFSSGGGSGKRAGAAWDQMLVEGYTEEERESPHTATQVCKEASRLFGWPQAPGDGEREGGDQKGLLEQAERFLRLRQLPRPQHPGRSRPGRSAVRLRGRPVPGWRELQLRSKALGKSRVCPSGGGESWKAAAATLQEESEGLAAAGSHPDTSSDAAAYSSTSASGRWRCSTRWVSRPTRIRGSSCV